MDAMRCTGRGNGQLQGQQYRRQQRSLENRSCWAKTRDVGANAAILRSVSDERFSKERGSQGEKQKSQPGLLTRPRGNRDRLWSISLVRHAEQVSECHLDLRGQLPQKMHPSTFKDSPLGLISSDHLQRPLPRSSGGGV